VLLWNDECYRFLQQEVPSWKFIDECKTAKDVVEIINKHAEPLPVTPQLKSVRFVYQYDKEKDKHFYIGEVTPEHFKKYPLKEFTMEDDELWEIYREMKEGEYKRAYSISKTE